MDGAVSAIALSLLMLWIGCGTLVEQSNKRGQGQTKEKSLLAVLFVWGYLVAAVLQDFCFPVVLAALSIPTWYSPFRSFPLALFHGFSVWP